MDEILAKLEAIEADLKALDRDISYHMDHDEISRIRANSQWIDVYVRRAKHARKGFADRGAFVGRLVELVDEVTAELTTMAGTPDSATSRVKRLLESVGPAAD